MSDDKFPALFGVDHPCGRCKGASALLLLCHPGCPERSRRDRRAAAFVASPLCHPACPERSRRDRSGPIFSSAPPFGASGREVEGSRQYPSTKRWRVGSGASAPSVSAVFWRTPFYFAVNCRSGIPATMPEPNPSTRIPAGPPAATNVPSEKSAQW